MELTILGSGTLIPHPNRGNSGYMLNTKDHLILIDGGAGAIRKAVDFGINYRNIDIINYTHLHPDHCFDLIPLMFALKHDLSVKLPKTIYIIAPCGFKHYYNMLMEIYGKWVLSDDIEYKTEEIENDSVIFDNIEIECRPTLHTDHSVSFRYKETGGNEIFYSGDTDYCDKIVANAKNATVLLLECSFPDKMKKKGHLTPSECGKIAFETGTNKLVLTHFYPEVLDIDIKSVVREKYDGEIILAYDGLQIEI